MSLTKRLSISLLVGLSLIVAMAFVVYVIAQQRARIVVNGATITVKAGGDFQAALDRANPGDTILLEAGATYAGPFILPKKNGEQFITVRSSASDSQLPAQGQRIDPQRYAPALPKIICSKNEPAIRSAAGAHHYRFINVEFGPTRNGEGNIIELGDGREKNIDELPRHIEFDRVYVHGSPTVGQRRGIAANGQHIRIINSHFADIKRQGDESQAIACWAGDGPIEIANNYLEAAAENVLFGGAGSNLKLVPSDIVVRDNHLNKPLEWRGEGWLVKNLFEIKNGRRVKVTNNLMTNNWTSGQTGTAVLFTVRADNGPATVIEDVEFTDNIVRGAGGAVSVYGAEGGGGRRLTIRNNVFEDIDGGKWEGRGQFLLCNEWDGLVIENNTILQTGNITSAYGNQVKGFVFRNNIIAYNEYGFHGENRAPGQDSIDVFFPRALVGNNAIIGGNSSLLKSRNMYPSSLAELKLTNPSKGDYRPLANSSLKGRGANGADIGANLDPQRVGRASQ
jgi:hypothetical protein